jgi:class I fructose-bisphosphate aldolase
MALAIYHESSQARLNRLNIRKLSIDTKTVVHRILAKRSRKNASMDGFLTNGRSMFLAYDQGLEHGPSKDFNDKNIDPSYIMDIAVKGRFNAIVFQKGLAERYYTGKVPLIIKVNGKAALASGEPISKQNCSVEYALSLGAKAVGYTIYLGSQLEADMFNEFGKIQEQAHEAGIPAIAWIYPRGAAIQNDTAKEIVAYAARTGLELGADAVKIKYTGDSASFAWAVKSAGKALVYMSGGPKAPTDQDFLNQVQGAIDAGATGLAVGRNVWQHPDPMKISDNLRQIIFAKKKKIAAEQVLVRG